MKNVLLLYSRYSSYVHSSFQRFTSLFGYTVHVIRYAPDKASPFKFEDNPNIKFYDRDKFNASSIIELIKENDIKIVIASGWRDQDYLKACRYVKNNGGLTIGAMDNQWMGTFKQKVFQHLGPAMLKRSFCRLWIPGLFQYEYARRLGFERFNILLNYYTADTDLFKYSANEHRVTRQFIYVGRLLEIKGTEVLIKALDNFGSELQNSGWKFLIIGGGDYKEQVEKLSQKYPSIEYIPFLQQKDLAQKTKEGGVFVLPSNYDAWSVAVHEFAAIGCPLLLSEAVGSRAAFLKPGYNGEVFATGSHKDLIAKMKAFISRSDDELKLMGERSATLAKTIDLDIWSYTLHNAIDDHNKQVKYTRLSRTKYA